MNAATSKDAEIKTLTTHYIDGAFAESHGPPRSWTLSDPTEWQGHRMRHAGRRGGYAARDRRGQARVRDLRSVDEGRAFKNPTPAA